MEDVIEDLWICPICSAEHPHPVIVCRRCGCQILLFNKIKLTALKMNALGYDKLASRLL
jgi:hypothetical protein